jgi:GTPase Era involved in 16S rRNA processing
VTDLSIEKRVEQVLLENLLDHAHEEIPYIATITCTAIRNINRSRVRIDVDIHVDTSGQQKIIIGHQGRTLVKVRQSSVDQLQVIMKKSVILFIWVKVKGKALDRENESNLLSAT